MTTYYEKVLNNPEFRRTEAEKKLIEAEKCLTIYEKAAIVGVSKGMFGGTLTQEERDQQIAIKRKDACIVCQEGYLVDQAKSIVDGTDYFE